MTEENYYPQLEGEKYYFLLGMIEGAMEEELLAPNHALVDATIAMLEKSESLTEEEKRLLDRYKYLQATA